MGQVDDDLYGTGTGTNQWDAQLSDTLRSIGFRTTRFDPDVSGIKKDTMNTWGPIQMI